jgi:hypothetical protein
MKKPMQSEKFVIKKRRTVTREEVATFFEWRRLVLFQGRSKPFADAIGITPQLLSAIINGRSWVSQDICDKLHAVDPAYWLKVPAAIVEVYRVPKKTEAK